MLTAVQKNLCELPKANDIEPSQSDDLTLNNQDISTTDEEDDCVYVSPDEAENGMSQKNFKCKNQILIFRFFSVQSQYSLIRTTMVAEAPKLRVLKKDRIKWKELKWYPYGEN